MSISERYTELFCHVCDDLSNDLQLNKTFQDLESGGKEYTYNSLVFCVIDAVFSIGVKYKSVENTVKKYAEHYNLNLYDDKYFDTHTVSDFIKNNDSISENSCSYEASMAKCVYNNQQRTSSRNGILKADACYQVAKTLNDNGINTLKDFQNLSLLQLHSLEKQIKKIKGQSSGIMFSYLCMLAGDDNTCKPDRWIRRFLKDNGMAEIENNDEEIQELFRESCKRLRNKYPNLTVRYLDYQIWAYQRAK